MKCNQDCNQGRDCPARKEWRRVGETWANYDESDTNPASIVWVQDMLLAVGLVVFTTLAAAAVGSILFWVVAI